MWIGTKKMTTIGVVVIKATWGRVDHRADVGRKWTLIHKQKNEPPLGGSLVK